MLTGLSYLATRLQLQSKCNSFFLSETNLSVLVPKDTLRTRSSICPKRHSHSRSGISLNLPLWPFGRLNLVSNTIGTLTSGCRVPISCVIPSIVRFENIYFGMLYFVAELIFFCAYSWPLQNLSFLSCIYSSLFPCPQLSPFLIAATEAGHKAHNYI